MAANPYTDLKKELTAPENPYTALRQELQQELDKPEEGGPSPFLASMSNSFVESLLGLPAATGDLLAGGSALLQGTGAKLTGGDFAIKERFNEEREKFPASLLRSIPQPSAEQAGAFLHAIPAALPFGESPGESYQRHLGEFEAESAALREQAPVASAFGDVVGSGLTLMTGRLPASKGIAELEKMLMNPKTVERGTEFMRLVDKVWKSPALRTVLRGAGRTAEAGAEGLLLSVMNGTADPLETAAFAAGSQAFGSATLGTFAEVKNMGKGPVAGILAASVTAGALIQTFKTIAPGGTDDPVESLEDGFNKVILGLVASGIAATAGLHRGGRDSSTIPVIADSFASLQRGTFIGFIESFRDASPEQQQKIELLLNTVNENPGAIGADTWKQIEKSLNSGTLVEDVDEIAFSTLPPSLNGNKK